MTREEVNAVIWKTNAPFPVELCARVPELRDYGFYRKLNNGKIEFLSFCSKHSRDYFAVQKDDLNEMLDKYLPKKK